MQCDASWFVDVLHFFIFLFLIHITSFAIRVCCCCADCHEIKKPTCNSIHEMDVSLLLSEAAFSLVSSKGFWRNAWKVNVTMTEDYPIITNSDGDKEDATASNHYAVLKSLK